MEAEKVNEEEYCSDDDIFISPCKRIEKKVKYINKLIVPVKGVYDETVKRLKSCLVGIPRPPLEPIRVDFKMEDIELFLNSIKSQNNDKDFNNENDSNRTSGRKLGIYLNVDNSCEELERLGSLYIEKYLPCETSSTMSDHSLFTRLTASAKKRRRCNGWATSPGSRLSYLAKRKSTFSVDQVSKLSQPTSSKQFLLQRDQMIKGVKSVPLKPKRALFQSPDEEKKNDPYRTPDLADRKRRLKRLSAPNPNSLRLTPRQQPKENRKERSCRKSLEFIEVDKGGTTNNESSDKHVKRKLLWAVSTALKSVSVTSSHPKFKLCMSKLFKSSLTVWNDKYQGRKTQENTFSTSEAMLAVAKSLLDEVVLPELDEPKSKSIDDTIKSNISDLKFEEERTCNENTCLTPENVFQQTLSDLPNSETSFVSTNGIKEETLLELSNPETSFASTNEIQGSVDINMPLLTSGNTFSYSPLRELKTNENHCINKKEEFRSSNHKRKRAELEDDEEEILNGMSRLDTYQITKSAKTGLHHRSVVNKLTSNGT
ncbi:hypothetical protein O3M35_005129 [Rhynocoris fuscipes]|uniref:Uncharacterized protein n=1 Tax=Rhynocoris fuscipes TaxID=488301 RepID=A0AAW1DJC4_9HEMI